MPTSTELVRFPVNGMGRFKGGLNNYLSPNLISDDELADVRSMLLDDRGNLFSRNGSSDRSPGINDKTIIKMGSYRTSGGREYIIAFTRDGNIYASQDGLTFGSAIGTGFIVDTIWEGCSFGGKFVCGNGVNYSQTYDGTTLATGSGLPTAAYWLAHKARVWAAGIPGAPKRIAACRTGDVDTWTPATADGDSSAVVAEFFGQDGSKIVGIRVFQDQIIVLTNENVGAIIGDGSPGTQFVMLNRDLGCLSGRTAKVYTDETGKQMLIFWASDGFFHAYLGGDTGDATGEEAARQFPRIDVKIDATVRGLSKPSTLMPGFRVDTKPEFDRGVLSSVESFTDSEGNGKVRLTKSATTDITAGVAADNDRSFRVAGAQVKYGWFAQSYDVSNLTGQTINSISVWLKKGGSPTGHLHIGLYRDVNGRIGEMIGGGLLDVATLTTSYTKNTITVNPWTIPSDVTSVWIGCKNDLDLALTDSNLLYVATDSGNVYTGGKYGTAGKFNAWPASWNDFWSVNDTEDIYSLITISVYAATGTYSSEVFDVGSNTTFSAFTGNIYMPSGSVEYWARADTSVFLKDAASPAWTDLGAGTNGMKNFILASLAAFQTKRYVQLRAVISAPSGQKTTPELDWMAVGYQGGTYISSLAEAVVRDGRYLCTCKTTDAAVNDTILVLDKNSAWTILKDLAVSSLHEHNLVLYGGKCFGDAPAAPVITNGGTPGSTTYGYKIVVHYSTGGTTALSAEGTTVTGNATLSGTNYNIITWSAVTGAASYKVYRTTGGATQGLIATITAGTETTNDTGIVATGGAPALSSLINADDSTATDDSGVDFDAYAITKALDLGYPEIRKDFRRIFVQHRDRSMSRTAYGRVQWSRDLGYLTGDEAWQDMSTGYALTPVSALGVTTTEIPQVDTAKGWLMSYRLGKTSDFDNPVEFQGLIVHALIREVGKKGKPTPTDPGEVFPLN